jgi:CubicO group peptidase (beta-lactamase class C family)
MRLSNIPALAAGSVLAVVAPATAAPQQGEAIASCMTRAAAVVGFTGSVYARMGDTVVERSFGAADAAGRRPISRETRFSMGSANKMFTAVAIGRLVDRGVVSFDAPIGRYLTGLKPEFASITIAQLLDHTAGLGDYLAPENMAAIATARTATDLLPLALATPPAFAPGSRRAYSNSGFVVLGAIIEKVSGLSYAEFVRREILDPLGMANTRFEGEGAATPMSRMSPTGMLNKARPVDGFAWKVSSPAGGMFSTPSDLSRFLTALAEGRLLSPATQRTLLTARPDPGGGPTPFGYGFIVREAPPARVGMGGGAPGINAEVALYRPSGWQLIALANDDPPAATRMRMVLEKAMFAEKPSAACAASLADPELMKAPAGLRMQLPGAPHG